MAKKTKRRGRPPKARPCTIQNCTALAVTGLKVCGPHQAERDRKRAERKARPPTRERLPVMTRAAVRARADRARDAEVYGPPGRAKFYVDPFPASDHKPRPEDDPRNWVILATLPGPADGAYRERSTFPELSPGINYLRGRRGFSRQAENGPPAKSKYTGAEDDGWQETLADRGGRRT